MSKKFKRGYESRKEKNRVPNKTLAIVCEGETERIYFQNYKERGSGLKINVVNPGGTDPESLVEVACKQREEEIWCVFDVDKNKDEKIKKAKKKGGSRIKICLSNPCFELWYLLHFQHNKDIMSAEQINDTLKKYLCDYSKKNNIFDRIKEKRNRAISNARKLNRAHEKNKTELLSTKSNPSTQVFKLVEFILSSTKKR